ncbi:MAG: hypothetical protein AB9M60_07735 [Leptothrix sp. (in: b-proteobacteria)]
MGFLDALGHLLNFFSPAFSVAAVAATLAKLIWRRDLAGARWQRLFVHAALAGALVWVIGLIATGRDGRLGSYLALVLANAIGLWWAGFGPRRR